MSRWTHIPVIWPETVSPVCRSNLRICDGDVGGDTGQKATALATWSGCEWLGMSHGLPTGRTVSYSESTPSEKMKPGATAHPSWHTDAALPDAMLVNWPAALAR